MIHENYIPSIGVPDWDIKNLPKEIRSNIKSRLVARITHSEAEYRAVISYLHMKFRDQMDFYDDDGGKFQWRYHTFRQKVKAYDAVGRCSFDMYGLVYYDPERDMEPVAVAGSYLREAGAIRDPYTHKIKEGQDLNPHTTKIRCGHGYIMFVDPSYRRMGIAKDMWLTEAQLYRDSGVHYQKENQTYPALQVTFSMFNDRSKVHIISNNRIVPGSNTKIIMDYFDPELEASFNNMPDGLKDFRGSLDWTFLAREGLTVESLTEPWADRDRKEALKNDYGSTIDLHMKVSRDLYERFRTLVGADNVNKTLVDYMIWHTSNSK